MIVYGPAIPQEKEAFLHILQIPWENRIEPDWIIGDEFNIILNLEEKRGGIRCLESSFEAFNDIIEYLLLVDIKTQNWIHTWNNRWGGHHQITCWLNHFLLSEDLILRDLVLEASILLFMGSNHWPISLAISFPSSPKNKPLKFESFWLRHPCITDKTEEWCKEIAVDTRTRMQLFQWKLKALK